MARPQASGGHGAAPAAPTQPRAPHPSLREGVCAPGPAARDPALRAFVTRTGPLAESLAVFVDSLAGRRVTVELVGGGVASGVVRWCDAAMNATLADATLVRPGGAPPASFASLRVHSRNVRSVAYDDDVRVGGHLKAHVREETARRRWGDRGGGRQQPRKRAPRQEAAEGPRIAGFTA